MDQEYTFKRILRGKSIFDQVGLVGVGREAVDRSNLCPHFVFFAEDFYAIQEVIKTVLRSSSMLLRR